MAGVGSSRRRKRSRIPPQRGRGLLRALVALVLLVGASFLQRLPPRGENLGVNPRPPFAVAGFAVRGPTAATRRRGRLEAAIHGSSLGRPQWAATAANPSKASHHDPALPRASDNGSSARQNPKRAAEPDGLGEPEVVADRRPHEQRVAGPRPARRLNHAFRHLYRGPGDGHGRNENVTHTQDQRQFLLGVGYTDADIVDLCRKLPPLLQLPVAEQLAPKVRFLRDTMQLDMTNQTERGWVPPEFFGLKLEAVVAPRHAFLMHANLPCGRRLVDSACGSGAAAAGSTPVLWAQFVKNCRQSTKHFAAFCQSLQSTTLRNANPAYVYPVITSRHVEAFQTVFSRGLLAAARDDLVQPNNTVWQPLQILDRLHSSDLVSLLVAHGANVTERDHRGATLLHWACGTGNLRAAKVLSHHLSVSAVAERDGATPLHWAAAGATPHEFGTGGHAEVCQFLMEEVQQTHDSSRSPKRDALREYINQPTKDGNTPLMWAAWSGTLDTVKLLVRSRADAAHRNRNGCTVAHWSASGGSLPVCRYLRDVARANFAEPNFGGNTPLAHAVAFGRADVVAWLTREVLRPATPRGSLSSSNADDADDDVTAARSLAKDMVRWTGGDHHGRNQVLQLFDEWADYEIGNASPASSGSRTSSEDDDDDFLLR